MKQCNTALVKFNYREQQLYFVFINNDGLLLQKGYRASDRNFVNLPGPLLGRCSVKVLELLKVFDLVLHDYSMLGKHIALLENERL